MPPSAVPIANDPIDALMREHQQYLARLEPLRSALNRPTAGGVSREDVELVESFGLFFEREIEGIHGRKEEKVLFPALRPHLPSPGPIDVMLSDHQQMRRNALALPGLAGALRNHPDSMEQITRLAVIGTDLAVLIEDHISKEDFVLFPMARQVLGRRELEEIAAACLEIEKDRVEEPAGPARPAVAVRPAP